MYHFLKSEANHDLSSTSSDNDRDLWKVIWSLHVPNKVKNLLWRACLESMLTKVNLVWRTIIDSPLCDRSRLEPETTLHALWLCLEIDVVWEDDELWECRRSTTFLNFKELLSWLIKEQHHLNVFSIIMWSIWHQWNQVHMHQPSCSRHHLTSLAKERLLEFPVVQPAPQVHPPVPQGQWHLPPMGMIKANFDRAIFNTEHKSGIGVVLKDDHGSVLASISRQVSQVYSPLEIEAMAATIALRFAADLGFKQVILEGDSQVLMTALINDSVFVFL